MITLEWSYRSLEGSINPFYIHITSLLSDKRISTVKLWNLPKSFVKKYHFQTMIFAIIFMIMNRYTCKLFKNILNDVQTEGNGKIITA